MNLTESSAPTRRTVSAPFLRFLALLCVASLSAVAYADTQTVTGAKLRARYVQFRGGEQALRALRVVERTGTMQYFGPAGEETGIYHTCVSYPHAVAIQIDLTISRDDFHRHYPGGV